MRAKDYKNTVSKPKAKERPVGSWVSFVSGLGIGLLVALGVYFWRGDLPARAADERTVAVPDEPESLSNLNFSEQADQALPKPKFDFYKILPEIEIKVSDWEISNVAGKQKTELNRGAYVLQVGSFKQHKDADRAKAKLALRGIQAKIHRVVINGQDVWYRVHIGPYTDIDSIQAMRAKLIESGNDYILLKIGDAAG
jgi:cell division protein FtsN